jgi:hypothetical protein
MKDMCPREEQIADYIEDRLFREQKAGIEAHFSNCTQCFNELLTIHKILQPPVHVEVDSVPEHVTDASVRLTAQLMSPRISIKERSVQFFKKKYAIISEPIKLALFNKNRFAPVRSTEDGETSDFFRLRKIFKEVVSEIEIEKTGRQTAVIRVTVVDGNYGEHKLRVTLLNSHKREVASFMVTGKFVVFENIPFGHYSLVFMQNGKRIGTYIFEIREST